MHLKLLGNKTDRLCQNRVTNGLNSLLISDRPTLVQCLSSNLCPAKF